MASVVNSIFVSKWEEEIEVLLKHWAKSAKTQIDQHEEKAYVHYIARIVLVALFLLVAALMVPSHLYAKGSLCSIQVGSFLVLAFIQTVLLLFDPSGCRERHLSCAWRYADLATDITDSLKKQRAFRPLAEIFHKQLFQCMSNIVPEAGYFWAPIMGPKVRMDANTLF